MTITSIICNDTYLNWFSTSDFVGNWTTGPDSFAVDAPNDVLIVENIQSGNLETAIVESFDPVYDTQLCINSRRHRIR